MNIAVFVVGAFQENTYLLADPVRGEAVFIDPGDNGDALADVVRARELSLAAIWLTHAHIDHIGGVAGLKRHFDVPVYMHPLDMPVYTHAADVAEMYQLQFDEPALPDRVLAEGDTLSVGTLSFRVMHLPGHAPGHVAFFGNGVLFGGDCLFAGSVGRTDLPLADPAVFASRWSGWPRYHLRRVCCQAMARKRQSHASAPRIRFLLGVPRPLSR